MSRRSHMSTARVEVQEATTERPQTAVDGSRDVLTLVDTSPDFSIRVPPIPQSMVCPQCADRFLASGPTGYMDTQAICDRCLFDGSPALGLLLSLASAARIYAGIEERADETPWEGLIELGVFARIYERYSSRFGPPRRLELDRDRHEPPDDPVGSS